MFRPHITEMILMRCLNTSEVTRTTKLPPRAVAITRRLSHYGLIILNCCGSIRLITKSGRRMLLKHPGQLLQRLVQQKGPRDVYGTWQTTIAATSKQTQPPPRKSHRPLVFLCVQDCVQRTYLLVLPKKHLLSWTTAIRWGVLIFQRKVLKLAPASCGSSKWSRMV